MSRSDNVERPENLADRMTFSVCISTCNRVPQLTSTLEALFRQTRLPEEIIVSEPALNQSRQLVTSVAAERPQIRLQYVPSERSALPWQRWWAFHHSTADVTLFLDDDVRLRPEALEALETAYRRLQGRGVPVSGIGFLMAFEGSDPPVRRPNSLRKRWLGTTELPLGSITSGGLTEALSVSWSRPGKGKLLEVEVLWGGAMSFRREVLEDVNCLKNLVALYDAGVGRGEDAVLSHRARQLGPLFTITDALALHPQPGESSGPAPYAVSGWRLGLTHTWGRAHTMRWLAKDAHSYRHDWWRAALLEVARCLAAIGRRPWSREAWTRLSGAAYGIAHSLTHWAEIPVRP